MERIIDKLKDFGLNTYEAKVYLALLKHHPATGYEISKESGVPQARAYDTLKALESRGVVIPNSGKPVTYNPVNPEQLLRGWERSYTSALSFLRETLPTLSNDEYEPVINIRGDDPIYKYAQEIIQHADENLFLELWRSDADKLRDDLQIAKDRGVNINIVGYDQVDLPFCNIFQHGQARTIENSLGGRWLIICSDDKEGLVGSFPPQEKLAQAVYTRNPRIVILIKELIVHDIFLLDVEEKLPKELKKVYGEGMFKLRRKIFGDNPSITAHH